MKKNTFKANHYRQRTHSESGNDYFWTRYYSSAVSRFMSADYNDDNDDPSPQPYADLESPQSLNLYSYVQNTCSLTASYLAPGPPKEPY
jgi:hypothetical protein